jgi:DNA polymerase III subunit delta'
MNPFIVNGALPLPWLAGPLTDALRINGHALMLHGGLGHGLFPLAMAWAQSQSCSAPSPTGMACGRCDDCRLVASQAHPDVRLLMPEALQLQLGLGASLEEEGKERSSKPSQDIRIDDLRAACEWGSRTPSRGARKALVIHPAGALNVASASALLKTLEEPPPSLRIVLTANAATDVMATVVSRCQMVRVHAVESTQALAWLREASVQDADTLLRAAGQEPLAALRLSEQGMDAAAWNDLPKAIAAGRLSIVRGWSVAQTLDTLMRFCHDAMRHAAGTPPRYFPVSAMPAPAPWPALVAWSVELLAQARHAEHPWHEAAAVEALATRAARVWQSIEPRSRPP